MAGDMADGIHVHPFHSVRYLQNRLLPAVAEGATRPGATVEDVDLIIPVFAVPGDTPEERAPLLERARFQIAFYGSTRNYAFQFDDLGFEGTSARLNERLKAGDLSGMAATITDEMLEHYAVVTTWDDLADTAARPLRRRSPSRAGHVPRRPVHRRRPRQPRPLGRGRSGRPRRRMTLASRTGQDRVRTGRLDGADKSPLIASTRSSTKSPQRQRPSLGPRDLRLVIGRARRSPGSP